MIPIWSLRTTDKNEFFVVGVACGIYFFYTIIENLLWSCVQKKTTLNVRILAFTHDICTVYTYVYIFASKIVDDNWKNVIDFTLCCLLRLCVFGG